jgi:hypothetical protein
MQLKHDLHLSYCTNIHRGESWEETWQGLQQHTLRVKERLSQRQGAQAQPFGIGLRLSALAAQQLSEPPALLAFQRWLEQHDCYVFTLNGFPYGAFHGQRVKEQVFRPDWSDPARLAYTQQLFDLLAKLLPAGMSGSVSTLPGSHKTFQPGPDEMECLFQNVRAVREHIETLSLATGKDLHLGFEPEPLGLFETTGETLKFFGLYLDQFPQDRDFFHFIGVNYDACHFALQYEEPQRALQRLTDAGLRISKLHYSSALSLVPTPANLEKLQLLDEPVYLHQVIVFENETQPLRRFMDVGDALAFAEKNPTQLGREWRIHFHVPLHAAPQDGLRTTQEHLLGVMGWQKNHPHACQHVEMETYTWEVLPERWQTADVVDQISREYEWTLQQLQQRGLAD